MAEPPLHTGNSSPQVRSMALERRRLELALQPIYETLEKYKDALLDPSGTTIAQFDNAQISTRELADWSKQAKTYHVGDFTGRALYCTAFIGEWTEGLIIGAIKQKDIVSLVTLLDNQKVVIPPILVFIWGEDLNVYAQRLEQAIYSRACAVTMVRFAKYVQAMPLEANMRYPPSLRAEIRKQSQPLFKQKVVMNFSEEKLKVLREKTLQLTDQMLDRASERFLKAQNRILFEQLMEKSPSVIAERQLELAKDQIIQTKSIMFYNGSKNDFVYEYLITPSTLSSFIPMNCQFDDAGNPIVTLDELRLNVGIFLVKHFHESQDSLLKTFMRERTIMTKIPDLTSICSKLTESKIRQTVVEKHSLAKRYQRELSFDEKEYSHILYQITQKSMNPVVPSSCPVSSLEDFKKNQANHQQELKAFLDDQWIVQIKQCISSQMSQNHPTYTLSAMTIEDFTKNLKLQSYLRRINFQIRDALIFLAQNSFEMFREMIKQASFWTVECKNTKLVASNHPDNVKIVLEELVDGDEKMKKEKATDQPVTPAPLLTVYRQPIFSIQVYVSNDHQATMEEKSFIDKMNQTYIYGVPPLFVNQKFVVDEDEKDEDANQQEEAQEDEFGQNQIENALDSNKSEKDEQLKIQSFSYLTNPNDFCKVVSETFQQGLQSISQIPKIEHVITKLPYAEKHYHNLEQQDLMLKMQTEILADMGKIISPLQNYLITFLQYRDLLFLDEQRYLATINYRAEMFLTGLTLPKGVDITPEMQKTIETAEPMSPADLKALVKQRQDQAADVLENIPDTMHVGAFLVKNETVRQYLSNKCMRLAEGVQNIIQQIANKKAQMVTNLYNSICKRLNKKPKNIEECVKQTEFIQTKLDKLMNELVINIKSMHEYYQLLDDLFVQQQQNQIAIRWKIIEFPQMVRKAVSKSEAMVDTQRTVFKNEQNGEQDQLLKLMENVQKQIGSFSHQFLKLDDYEEANRNAVLIMNQLKQLQDKAAMFNKREALMGIEKTDYANLDQIVKDFDPQFILWGVVTKFNVIEDFVLHQDLKKIDSSKTIEEVDQQFKDITKAIRNLKDNQVQIRDLAEQMKVRINEFRKQNELLMALRNPAMRKRHWVQLSKLIGQDLRNLRYINGIEAKNYGQEQEEPSGIDYAAMSETQIKELNDRPVNYTFTDAKNRDFLGADKTLTNIKIVSSQASSQFMIEKTIDELDNTWSKITFTLAEYQSSGSYILKQLDEVIQQLDDSITMIQSMSFAPFKDFFLKAIAKWETNLTSSSEIIEVWIQVQQLWLYLEPIFASSDIARQLPTESRVFRQTDTWWRQHMNRTFKNPNVISICTTTKDLLKNLSNNHEELERVQKGLADYLETKRIAFPRFFFLSDEELLSILSNTKNPTAVQPFLRSCFENVARIKFLDPDYAMISMTSHEGEIVKFVEQLLPQGQVENWMTQLEKLIIQTIKMECMKSLIKYEQMVMDGGTKGRANWVKTGFSQGLIVVNQLAFSNDTEWAINNGKLKKYQEQLELQLICMTDLVREGLNKLESKCFSAILTYDVFQRDQVQALIAAKVSSVTDFEWLKHPKHFCNIDEFYVQPTHGVNDNFYNDMAPEQYKENIGKVVERISQTQADNFQISFNQISSTLPYAFEYIPSPRLVITSLTLKIYSTIAQSQSMYKFSAASGPAGSGKTETSKQMTNKELGLVCVVFNCSEGLDLIGIKRMLSGVISSGGCLVMDEINRLSLDVLSVFAQMVLGVQRGLQACGGSMVKPAAQSFGKAMAHIQRTKYVFESAELNLQSTATVIITQNPNYSGRQKLPANLVALFRAVSVMVPNYNKICQIRLYSFGFKKATSLAQKAVSVFKLCSEQLSQCSWYDYGMRAINSTIQAAGNIRQELGTMCLPEDQIPMIGEGSDKKQDPKYYTEDQIVLRAITEVNLPKFLENDAMLFGNILKDLFPGIKQPYIDYEVLKNELKIVLRSSEMNYLQGDDSYINKIVDLYMTINLRHGLMTLGNACSGKGMSIYSLMTTLNRLNQLETNQRIAKFKEIMKLHPEAPVSIMSQHMSEAYKWERMQITRLNPKAITMDQLFGQFDPISKEWHDGILSTLVRNAVADYNKWTTYVEQNLYAKGFKQGTTATVNDVSPEVYVQKQNYTRQIVLHDGYIDSLWIESLNTVLDDSKRLCLTSGEIICLTPVMNMLFSMDSVAEASPATISRCGMLYFTSLLVNNVGGDERALGQVTVAGTISPNAYIQTWIDRLPDQLRLDEYKQEQGQVVLKTVFKTKHLTTEKLSVMSLVFKEMLGQFAIEAIAFINSKCETYQQVMDSSQVLNLFRLLDSFIREIKPNDFGIIEQWQIDAFRQYQEAIFIFSLIWSIGATICTDKSRMLFDYWLRKKIVELSYLADNPIPDQINSKKATVFDFQLKYDPYDQIKEKTALNPDYSVVIQWLPWGEIELQKVNMDNLMLQGKTDPLAMQHVNLSDAIIPTASNIQQQYVLRRLLTNQYPTLVVGSTGSGKTAVIKDYLMNNKEDAKTMIPLLMTFSANTQAGQVQEFLDGKVEKRRRGVFGPPTGKKFIFYIDDLNLPMKERYGCINSHELTRSLICHEGWYDLKELTFKQVIETTVVSSMVQSGGSRNPVTQRLLRHFNTINFLEMNDQQTKKIFTQIIEWWSAKQFDANILKDASAKLQTACKKLVDLGISVYEKVRIGLLPTPSKEHYTYNLRDLSKLFQGFMMVEPKNIYIDQHKSTAANQVFLDPNQCVASTVKCFLHEIQRVFGDRLINNDDNKWLSKIIDEQMQKIIGIKLNDLLPNNGINELLYCDFVSQNRQAYQQITDMNNLQQKLQVTLSQCNDEMGSMNLVLFKMAIQHLSRIVRILRQDGSNILLIGVGGVGRQSLTKLAAYHLNFKVCGIEISKNFGIAEWKEAIKKILLECGLENKPQVFLLADQHIFSDKQLEDISILLNTCDLQSIYEPEDMAKILDSELTKDTCKKKELMATKQNLYDCYLKNVKANIHIVLCFSPSGSALRTRLRKFPSLVNCCSIDYMSNWTREAMISVGKQIYGFGDRKDLVGFDSSQMELLTQFIDDMCKVNNWQKADLQNKIIEFCVDVHESIEHFSLDYKKEQNRYNHITPTLYLNALTLLFETIDKLYKKTNQYKKQLTSGLDTLKSTQEKVAVLQIELTKRQPELVQISASVDSMMIQLEKDKKEAEGSKQIVSKEKQISAQKFQECDAIKQEADREMAQVQPLLDQAVQVLKLLDKSQFIEMASYATPSQQIKAVLEAICIMLKIKPKKVNGVDEYWDEAKKLLSNYMQLKESLEKYDKENMSLEIINKLKKYISEPWFNPQEIYKKSQAASGLCAFVCAMYKFYFVNLNVIPKRQKQAEAQAELDIVDRQLRETEARFDAANKRIQDLEKKFNEALAEKERLAFEVEDTSKRLERAQTLMVSLGGEQTRWTEQLREIAGSMKNILGNALFATACVIYQGAFNSDFRRRISTEWMQLLKNHGLFFGNNEISLTDVLSDQVTLMNYVNQYKLPSDQHSMQNAVMMFTSKKYSLLIDPEQQAQAFIRNFFKSSIEVVKATDVELQRTLQNCFRFGKILLIIGVENEIDPALTNIIEQKYERENGSTGALGLSFDGNFVPLNTGFKLFMCTHLSNPNYQPEQFVRLCVVNFAITQQGLQDQLLGQLFAKEQREQEEQKNTLVIEKSKMNVQLKDLEQQVLTLLGNNDSDILSNEPLIETLSLSQKTSKEIQEKVKESEITEANIDNTRKEYIPMARRGSILYFCVQDLMRIDFMYQNSLQWYINLYNQSIDQTEQCTQRFERIEKLINHFTSFLYETVCRSLFDEHKQLFSLLIAIRIAQNDQKVGVSELKFLLVHPANPVTQQNPCPQWLTDKSFFQIVELANVSSFFKNIVASFQDLEQQAVWRSLFEANRPEENPFPSVFNSCSSFQRFLPLICLRPDRILAYARIYLRQELGELFVQPQIFSINASYKDSSNLQPLLFILGDMADPISDLMAFAESQHMAKRTQVLSLGRGVEKPAITLIQQFAEKGGWCVLQNCHLCVKFLKMLEQTLETLQADPSIVSRDFRLWLTSQPTTEFPVPILQNSVKISVENPNDLKANLQRVWLNNISEKQLQEGCKEQNRANYKKLAYSLTVFYAVLLQRKKYGSIGFNTPYAWSAADIAICIQQLPTFLDSYSHYPKDALHYLFAQINIGGCVTDAIDQRTVDAIVEDYLTPEVMQDGWVFQLRKTSTAHLENDLMQFQKELTYQEYLDSIAQTVPIECDPCNLGLNMNSNISSDRNMCESLLNNMLSMNAGKLEEKKPSATQEVGKEANTGLALIESITQRIPKPFDIDAIVLKYPTVFEESLNSLLVQECGRFNILLQTMQVQCAELIKALQGQTIMSDELERILVATQLNKLPDEFARYSYPSLKPFGSYLQDLNERVTFFQNWIQKGKPKIFSISSFFFAQGFLTSVLQNYARKYSTAIDTISWNFQLTDHVLDDSIFIAGGNEAKAELLHKFGGGKTDINFNTVGDCTFISGLYLEAAALNETKMVLQEAAPRQLFYKMPVLRFTPVVQGSDMCQSDANPLLYECPCYRTLARFGTLSTTGHSTNFLLMIYLPCESGKARHWIKRSVALFASLSE